MIQYSEQQQSSQATVYENEIPDQGLARERVSLSQIWQYLTRTKSLPDGLDLDAFFSAIRDKLSDPEWEVRQHALRVLRDFIRATDSPHVDARVDAVFEDLVLNLGHISPAVRKAAVDCLRGYLKQSGGADETLRNLFRGGVGEACKNGVQTNVVLGIILAAPFLIVPKISDETLGYVVGQLVEKAAKGLHTETAMRSLIRIRYILGDDKFGELLKRGESKESFEKMFEMYDVNHEYQLNNNKEARSVWRDFNENLFEDLEPIVCEATKNDGHVIEDRVILETEIKLDSGPAVTMQLHEQSRQNSFNETTDSEEDVRPNAGIVKVLTDDSEQDDEVHRKTPRRVRFGGEIVKMRTPDSDSNGTGDEKECAKRHTKSAQGQRSKIPIRVRKSASEPSSPQRAHKTTKLYKSTPNLISIKHTKGSKIPRKNTVIHSTIKITIDNTPKKEKSPERKEKAQTKIPPKQNLLSPTQAHQGIEILYNLTQSPQRTKSNPEVNDLNRQEPKKEDEGEGTKTAEQSDPKRTFDSFQVCEESFEVLTEDRRASFVPIESSTDASISDSKEDKVAEYKRTMKDLQRQEDVTTRLRALRTLLNNLKSSADLEVLQSVYVELLSLLFSAYDHPALRLLSQENLSFLFENAEVSLLENKSHYIALCLSKMGMPDGVYLATKLLKRFSVAQFVDQLLSKTIRQAKSSKIREGSVQIMIGVCRLFPSTDIEVTKISRATTHLLTDRKRKVRQAALELSAVLAQLGSIALVLDIAASETREHPERERILRVLRNRLSRKQLPMVDSSGFVRYSTPIGEPELEWLSLGNPSNAQRIHSSLPRINDIGTEFKDDRVRYWKPSYRSNSAIWTNDYVSTKDQENARIWTIDPSNAASSQPVISGTLRPIYVLQPNISTVQNVLDFSSNKRRENESFQSNEYYGNKSSSSKQTQNESSQSDSSKSQYENSTDFRKSFSSDNIRNEEKFPQFSSVSSGCSSTSGSSTRSGTWNRDMRSGIPVAINSYSRTRFKGKHLEPSPMRFSSLRSKHSSPEKESLPIPRAIPFTERISSGSESSGYFTPPAEPPLPNSGYGQPEKPITNSPQPETPPELKNQSFVRIDSPKQAREDVTVVEEVEETSFVIQESEESDNLSPKEDCKRADTPDSLDDVDFEAARFRADREFSKSEADLKQPVRTSRTLKSAPIVNDCFTATPIYRTVNETTINITNAALPGSVDVTVQSQVETIAVPQEKPPQEQEKKPPKRALSRSLSKRSTKPEQFDATSDSMQPFAKPREALGEVLAQLESSDWEATIRGLKGLVRLKKHNAEVLEPHMHNICVALGKHVKNLRSQVSRAACTAAVEMFAEHKKSLEMEVEEIAAPLLQRTADTNKFLRSDANAALDAMCAALPPPKVVAIVTTRGCVHQNALVRATSARLLCNLVHRMGAERVFQMPRETRDKILLAGANMLLDGNLDTRKSAKMMLSHLCSHAHFHKAMLEVVPTCTMRHIQKTLKSLK